MKKKRRNERKGDGKKRKSERKRATRRGPFKRPWKLTSAFPVGVHRVYFTRETFPRVSRPSSHRFGELFIEEFANEASCVAVAGSRLSRGSRRIHSALPRFFLFLFLFRPFPLKPILPFISRTHNDRLPLINSRDSLETRPKGSGNIRGISFGVRDIRIDRSASSSTNAANEISLLISPRVILTKLLLL